jgi:obg-like ATPase 1
MPPKKAAAPEKKTLLGRPSNNLKIGIVGLFLYRLTSVVINSSMLFFSGLPNVGKSSFFNALSETGAWLISFYRKRFADGVLLLTDLGKAANFPYATINPEEARIPVPDARFEWLCETYKPVSRVPAFLTCIDIAGLTAVRCFTVIITVDCT